MRTLDDVAEFIRRAQAAQGAVDKIVPRKDGMDKIRKKGGPKDYKSGGPGPTGRDRLQRRVNGLALAASRLARKAQGSDEGRWAERLVEALKAFNAETVAAVGPTFDVDTFAASVKSHVNVRLDWTCTICQLLNHAEAKWCRQCGTTRADLW